jgi:hypothetical protein
MTRKRQGGGEEQPGTAPQRGVANPGKPMRPKAAPKERDGQPPARRRPRAAPAPGVPVTDEEYDRLKREAETAPAPGQAPEQEDRPATEGAE